VARLGQAAENYGEELASKRVNPQRAHARHSAPGIPRGRVRAADATWNPQRAYARLKPSGIPRGHARATNPLESPEGKRAPQRSRNPQRTHARRNAPRIPRAITYTPQTLWNPQRARARRKPSGIPRGHARATNPLESPEGKRAPQRSRNPQRAHARRSASGIPRGRTRAALFPKSPNYVTNARAETRILRALRSSFREQNPSPLNEISECLSSDRKCCKFRKFSAVARLGQAAEKCKFVAHFALNPAKVPGNTLPNSDPPFGESFWKRVLFQNDSPKGGVRKICDFPLLPSQRPPTVKSPEAPNAPALPRNPQRHPMRQALTPESPEASHAPGSYPGIPEATNVPVIIQPL